MILCNIIINYHIITIKIFIEFLSSLFGNYYLRNLTNNFEHTRNTQYDINI